MMACRAKKTASGILIIAFLFISAVSYGAEYANPQLLVTPSDIEKNKGKWIVVDCRDDKAYAAGHIPGAINLGGACGKVLRDTTLRIKKTGELEKLLGEAGVSMDKPVVVYADAKLITGTTVAFWALEYLGHTDVRFLNGGIEEWQSVGKPLDNTKTKLPPVTFKSNVVKNRIATTDEMVRIAKGEIKNVNVIDSRSEKENKGEDIRSVRGGHIPNTTINVSHTDTYHVETGTLYSADGLEMLFGKLDMNKRTIPYCQTGTRSTLTYLELRLMGFKEPANYDDSWIIYGSNVDCPVANENWYDFVKVNDALKKIDALSKEIEELKKR
ncbi:MAG: rhodanese-like domain-containing protein [Thermodesulfovibrionales bacterium]